MFKNKIKYSLLVGSIYNVKCDYIFNVYINGKKTSISKTINRSTLLTINIGSISKDEKFKFDGYDFDSYEKYKEENPSDTFDNYLRWVLFYKEKNDGNSEFNDCLYDNKMKYSTEEMVAYTPGVDDKQILKYDDIKDCGSYNIKIDVYYVKKAEYKILNLTEVLSEDFINSFKDLKDNKKNKINIKEEINSELDKLKKIDCCLTYEQLLRTLVLFDVYIDGKQINKDEYTYITPGEAKKLFLLPKLGFQKKKKIELEFYNNGHSKSKNITIPSYVTLKYIKESLYYNSKCEGEICYDISHHGGLEFYNDSAYVNKMEDNNNVKGNIYVKVKKYFVNIYTDLYPGLLSNGELVEVENLNKYIEDYKKNKKLIGKKHYIAPVIGSDIFSPNVNYENCLTNHIYVKVSSTEDEPKEGSKDESKEELKEEHIETNIEEHIEEIKEEHEEEHIETNPEGHKQTGDLEMVKKTALINECNKLVNKIKALDSSYTKTINGSDSVEILKILKTELTNKLSELKNKKPKDKEVPGNPDPITSTGGEDNSTNEETKNKEKGRKCGKGSCKNKNNN